MKCKLYYNTRRFTQMFCIGIVCVTLSVLALRLTVFSDMAVVPASDSADIITAGSSDGSVTQGLFPYKINGTVYFSKADAKGNVLIQNPEANQYLMSVDIRLADSGDSLYSTGFINPGASIDSDRLGPEGQKLTDGVYDCIAEISVYDPDTLEAKGSETQNITLYIGDKPEKK